MRKSLISIAIAASAATPASAQRSDVELVAAERPGPTAELSTGIEYHEGEFGTGQRIETIAVPASLRVTRGNVQLAATLPYLRIDAPGNVVGGGGGLLGLPIIVDPTQPATREHRAGIGDLRLGATYTVPSASVGLAFTGQIKAPTASESKGLGSGAFDYSLGAELSKSFGRVTPFVGVGYTMPGDPDGYDLRDGLSARAGAAVRMTERVRGHFAYGYARSLSLLVPDEQQLSTGINAALGERLSLGLYGSAGLSDGSPDIGAGLRLGVGIF